MSPSPSHASVPARVPGPVRATLPRRSFVAAPETGAPSASSGTVQPETAERLGHDFGRVTVQRVAAGGGVIQRQPSDHEMSEEEQDMELGYSSEEEDDDSEISEEEGSDWEEDQKKSKQKKPDPKAGMVGKPNWIYASPSMTLAYKTVGGAQHEETRSLSATQTDTKHLTPSLGFRNDAKRPDKSRGYYSYNHFGDDASKGQRGLNQAVASHQTPSWLGMYAGGDYGNMDMTSSQYNKQVEGGEKDWRGGIKKTHKYGYTTNTKKEEIATNLRAQEIADQPGMRKHWSKDRIEKRLNRLVTLHPKEQRVVEQKRTLVDETDPTNSPPNPLSLGVDYHYGLPARAYSEKAQKEYKKARLKTYDKLGIKYDSSYDGSSEESDSDLYEDPPSWMKKGT